MSSTNSKRTKSRHGCLRCKERKQKCDETKPACLNCSRVGIRCPGYVQQLKWLRKHERFGHNPGHLQKEARNGFNSNPPDRAGPQNQRDCSPIDFPNSVLDDAPSGEPTPFPQLSTIDWMDLISMDTFPHVELPFPDTMSVNQPFEAVLPGGNLPWPNQTSFQGPPMPLCSDGVPASFQACNCSSDSCNNDRDTQQSNDSHYLPIEDISRTNFLETFYRISLPSSTPHFSAEHLIKHYFNDVCSLFSCFDSRLNPFRTLVADELKTSTTISLSVQSMSIAHLANHYLYMAPLGMAKRSQAWKSLQSDLRLHRNGQISLETLLLALLLLGFSSSWHQPSNLGLPYLFIARGLVQGYFRNCHASKPRPRLRHEKFFMDALMHWEMLASFLDPVPMMSFPGYGMPDPPAPKAGLKMPHPWTGVSPELHFALAEIGRIMRRRQRWSGTESDGHDLESIRIHDQRWAAKLENFLHSIALPDVDDIENYEDPTTPKSDLVRVAHAYRFVGLMEIYRCFDHLHADNVGKLPSLPLLYGKELQKDINHTGYTRLIDSTLSAISAEVLEIVKDISISSSASRLLPLVLVSCSSHLRFPDVDETSDNVVRNTESTRNDQIIDARYMVESRMLALSRRYPQKQMLQILDLIKEVWDRLDNNTVESSHWMDIMQEKQLQTILG